MPDAPSLTPEQLEKRRAAVRRSYYKNHEKYKAYYRQLSKKRSAEDPEGMRAYRLAWYQRTKERALFLKRKRRAAGKDPALYDDQWRLIRKYPKIEEADKKKRAALQYARWSRANPHICAAIVAKRRAVKRMATPSWADQSAIRVFYEIAARVSKCTGINHEVDHYYPLKGRQVCGLHCEQNLQVIPAVLNMKKGSKCP